ncbi:MgtC/SapB family protein [Arenimonas sp. MALMAid1274]|uniref:MgtC/SapB family protein n=1 Tax=Arenimonas sp. MALMAid1274 TaxID=3411630 RepID=UPI003BA0E76D
MDGLDQAMLLSLATALGLGLLVGAVRERRHPEGGGMAGLRTHALAALAGAVSLWLGLAPFVVVLALLGVFVALGYRRSREADPGLTGEIALLLTCLLGGLAMRVPALAGALGVVAAVLLYAKAPLHRLARDLLSERELQDGLVLLASALVVLPLVPDRTLGPFDVFNPATLWKLVVLVMAISAVGHVALRATGNRWGLAVAGFFAGFVSSTAAIAGFGQRVRDTPALLSSAVGAAMLANLASLLLFIPILLAVAPSLLPALWPELAAAGAVMLAGGLLGLHRGDDADVPAPTAQTRMFRFSHALLFAAIITAVLFVSAALNAWLGPRGAITAAVLAALAELHAAVATIGNLFSSGVLDAGQARWTLVGILSASWIAKTVVAWTSGGRGYGLRVCAGLGAAVAAAGAVLLFT